MDLKIKSNFKSLTPMVWEDIPRFAIITGPNGAGKSHLLEVVRDLFLGSANAKACGEIALEDEIISGDEVSFISGEWTLQQANPITFVTHEAKWEERFNSFKQQPTASINRDLVKRLGKAKPNEITKEIFVEHYPLTYSRAHLQAGQSMADVFYDYRIKQLELKLEGLEDGQIAQRLGEAPWTILRQIIQEAKLNFEITDPSHLPLRGTFVFKISDTKTGVNVNLSDLSSGEKVLISLAFMLFNSQQGHVFQKLLLLDEPDAHLHSAMSRQFIDVVKNVLVDKIGIMVIMTTHSPSTVILAPEGSLFEMSKSGQRLIKAQSKNHAVSLLT